MYCLANICYVCLQKKNKLININRSSLENKDIIYIIGYLPFNLAWLKTLQIILICEECCLRLRETCQFLEMCLKNSSLLQGYVDNLNSNSISSTANEAELFVHLNMKHEDTNVVNREIKLEDDEIYTFQWEPVINETQDVFVDLDDSLVKEGIICKKEEVHDDREEYRMDISTTGSMDNETDSDISVNSNAHIPMTDSISSGSTCKQVHETDQKDLNTPMKPYLCSTCKKSFSQKGNLVCHMRTHTGEKPYACDRCNKCFIQKLSLVNHMRTHTGEKPFACDRCKKCFIQKIHLAYHMRTHTGEKPYACDRCKKCFRQKTSLVQHMRIHTDEKPYACDRCKKCFRQKTSLVQHMRIHTDEKPYACDRCKKCFSQKSSLLNHMRIHTGEKPYACDGCKKCFSQKTSLVQHMRKHTAKNVSLGN